MRPQEPLNLPPPSANLPPHRQTSPSIAKPPWTYGDLVKACKDLENQGISISERIIDTLPRLKPCFEIGSLTPIQVESSPIKELTPLSPKTIRSL